MDLVLEWFSRLDEESQVEALKEVLSNCFGKVECTVVLLREDSEAIDKSASVDVLTSHGNIQKTLNGLTTLFTGMPVLIRNTIEAVGLDPDRSSKTLVSMQNAIDSMEFCRDSMEKGLKELCPEDDIEAQVEFTKTFVKVSVDHHLCRIAEIAPGMELTLVLQAPDNIDASSVFTNSSKMPNVIRFLKEHQNQQNPGFERRLYGKFILQKANGEPLDPGSQYFVLRYDEKARDGAASRLALETYCDALCDERMPLVQALRSEIKVIRSKVEANEGNKATKS